MSPVENISFKTFDNVLGFLSRKSETLCDNSFEKTFLSKRLNSIEVAAKYFEFKKIKPTQYQSFIESLPVDMTGMYGTLEMLSTVVLNNQKTIVACDYDADGLGAASILKKGFELLGYTNVAFVVSDRYKGGYGFNEQCLDRILSMEYSPDLVITVDEGSSDEVRIKKLKEQLPDTRFIVTDHHHVPENWPQSADAFVNPNQKGDKYPYKNICGAAVALLVIKSLAEKLSKKIDIGSLIEICAISTIGDVMPLNEPVNRVIVKEGLRRANQCGLPFWNALKKEGSVIDESTIGFDLAPKINAMSRMGKDPEDIIRFLTSDNPNLIKTLFTKMTEVNQARKDVNEELYFHAHSEMLEQVDDFGHILFLEKGLSGVTGILASRIKEETGKPVICFCPKKDDDNFVTGSGRSIEGVDIRGVIELISEEFSSMNYGGHPAACGLTIQKSELLRFKKRFNEELEKVLHEKPEKQFTYDFDLKHFESSRVFLEQQDRLKPYGQKFEAPIVKIEGILKTLKLVGKGSLSGVIEYGNGQSIKFIWFGVKQSKEDQQMELEDELGATIVGKVDMNYFNGVGRPQILVEKLFV